MRVIKALLNWLFIKPFFLLFDFDLCGLWDCWAASTVGRAAGHWLILAAVALIWMTVFRLPSGKRAAAMVAVCSLTWKSELGDDVGFEHASIQMNSRLHKNLQFYKNKQHFGPSHLIGQTHHSASQVFQYYCYISVSREEKHFSTSSWENTQMNC